jgi:hypothetical protein
MAEAGSAPTTFQINVPPEFEAGAYANTASVWFSLHEFTVDFAVTMPPRESTVPCRVVARLKLPPMVVPQLISALQRNLDGYRAAASTAAGGGQSG